MLKSKNVVLLLVLLYFCTPIVATSQELDLEEIRGKTADLASAAGDFAADLSEIDAAKSFESLNKIIAGLDSFSKLASALGFVGGGIEIVGLFLPQEEDPVLTAISKLDDKVSGLRIYLQGRIDRLEDKGNFTALRTAMIDDQSTITAASSSWNGYAELKDADAFSMWTADAVETAATGIATYCDKEGEDNLFRAVEKDSYGDIKETIKWGTYSVSMLYRAQLVDAAIQYLAKRNSPKNNKKSDQELLNEAKLLAEHFYTPLTNRCLQGLKDAVARLSEDTQIDYWAQEYLIHDYLPNIEARKWTKPGVAKDITNALKAKFPQREWLTIKYYPVAGDSKPYFAGTSFIDITFNKNEEGEPHKIIVHFWMKGRKYSTATWSDLPISRTLRNQNCIQPARSHLISSGPARDLCKDNGDVEKELAISEFYDSDTPIIPIISFGWYGRLKPDYHSSDDSFVYSSLRHDAGVSQIVSMEVPSEPEGSLLQLAVSKIANQVGSDVNARSVIDRHVDYLKLLDPKSANNLIEYLFAGKTGNEDEKAIITLMSELPKETVKVLVEKFNRNRSSFEKEVDGEEWSRLEPILNRYPATAKSPKVFSISKSTLRKKALGVESDVDARAFIIKYSAQLKRLNTKAAANLLDELFSGKTGNEDERAIITLIDSLPSSRVQSLAKNYGYTYSAYESDVDGVEWKRLRKILKDKLN